MRHALAVSLLASCIAVATGLSAQAASLDVQPGVVVKFGSNAGLVVRDKATVADNVSVTSQQDNGVGSPISTPAVTPAAGDWQGIRFERSSFLQGSTLGKNLFIRYAGTTDAAALQMRGFTGTLDALRIESSTTGLKLTDSPQVSITGAGFGHNATGISADVGTGVTVAGSAFSGQTQFAISNQADNQPVIATGNWWGHATGPKDASGNPAGLGDPVGTGVNYGQWRNQAPLLAPVLRLTAPAAYVDSSTVDVQLGCLNATEFRLSQSPTFSGASFAAMTSHTSFTFSDGDGAKSLYVQYRDASGQTITTRLANDVVVDTHAPTIDITSPAPSSVIVSPVAIEAQATDASGIASVEFLLGTTRISLDSAAPYSAQLDTSVIPDGEYVLAAVATDGLGKTSRIEFPITVARVALPPDTVGPTITNAKFNDALFAPDTFAKANGSITAAASDRSGVSRVEFLLDDALIGTDSTAESGGVYRATLNLTGVANGTHTIKIRGIDSLDNKGESEYPIQVLHDPPPAPQIQQPSDGAVVRNQQIDINGSTTAGYRVHLIVNGNEQTAEAVADSHGAFQLAAALQVGDNTISAVANDSYGASAPSTVLHVVVDQTVPPSPSSLQVTTLSAGKLRLSWALSSDPKATGYDIYRAPTDFSALAEAQKVGHTAVSVSSFEDVPVTDGRYFYRVVAINALGTPSLPSNQVNAVSDKTLPFAVSIIYQPQGAFDAASTTFGAGRVGVTVTVNEPLLATPYLSLVPAGGLPMPVDLSKRDDTHYEGTLTIAPGAGSGVANALFSARDLIGNRGVDVHDGATLLIDTVGPTLNQIAVSPQSPINASASSAVTATLTLSELVKAGGKPSVSYALSGPGRSAVVITDVVKVSELEWTAHLQLPADAGQASPEQLSFSFAAADALGNVSTQIKGANAFQVYQGELPALDVPLGLQAKATAGGNVQLAWQPVDGASAYQVYRQSPQESALTPLHRVTTATDTDPTSVDGVYRYTVASIRSSNGQETQSGQSAIVTASASRTAPGAPQNLALSLNSHGVLATWQPPVGGLAPASYRLYRASGSSISSVTGLTPIKQGIATPQALDGAPSQAEHAYVVTAVDAAGNESALSNSVYLNFGLLPVQTLQVEQLGSALPVVSWTPNGSGVVGYDVYVGDGDGRIKLTSAPTTATSLTDTGFTGGERHYTVETVDQNDVRMARGIILPKAVAQIVSGLPLKRNVMNRLGVQVANLSASALSSVRLVVKVGTHTFTSEDFSLASNATRVVPVVVGGYPDLTNPSTLTLTLESRPDEGDLARLAWSVPVEVVDSALVVGLEADSFVRGATGNVRLTVENSSDVEVELLTARSSGTVASNELRLKLLDNDGNLLSTTPFRQATGAGVITLANGETVARIAPGQRYVSGTFVMPVPSVSPDQVRLRVEVDTLRYNSGEADQVTIPGLGSEKTVSLTETPYLGEVTGVDPVVSNGTHDITIQGRALDRGTHAVVANAPLKLAINQEGFERLVDVTSNESGAFQYLFKPSLTDAGVYHVGAIHPDMTDRPDQAQFTINRVNVGPQTFKLSVPRNYPYRIDFRATTGTGSHVSKLKLVYTPELQPSGSFLPGITVQLPNPIDLVANQNLALPVSVSGDNTAAPSGRLVLAVQSDDSGAESLGSLTIDYTLTEAKPALFATPNYVEAGLAQGQSVIESVSLENKGFVAMSDVTAQLLDKDGNAAPAWVSLANDPNIGSIGVGEKRNVDLNIAPGAQVAEGIYPLKLRIAGSNLPAEDVNVFVSVTQSGQGSVLFKAADIYTATRDKNGNLIPGLASARIFLQNENVISQTYDLTTDAYGEALFQNLPAGSYKYKASAANHQETSGRFSIKPGLTVNQSVFLEYTLITVEWSVREVTIEDRYEITLNATFETDVPAPVVVLQPTSINLPKMAPGEVFQGELTLTNYGLLRADALTTTLPESDDYFKFEFLAQPPTSLDAKQRVRLPYRVIALRRYGDDVGTTAQMVTTQSVKPTGGDTRLTGSSVSTGSPRMTPASISGTPGCYTYTNKYREACKYTCANGVESTNCGSNATWFYEEHTSCPVGTSPVGGGGGTGSGGVDPGGNGGIGSGTPTYSDVPGLPVCTKGNGECFQPTNKQSDTGKEGGQ